jgi:hypothetical protein
VFALVEIEDPETGEIEVEEVRDMSLFEYQETYC